MQIRSSQELRTTLLEILISPLQMPIYLVTNKVNGKLYVGKTLRTVQARWQEHIRAARRGSTNSVLHAAIRKYGTDGFTVETLYESDDEADLLRAEVAFIAFYDSTNKDLGYNLTVGGEGTSGWKHSQESKQHLADVMRGRYVAPETIDKHKSLAIEQWKTRSRVMSEEQKEKIRASMLKASQSPEWKEQRKAILAKATEAARVARLARKEILQ